MQKIITYLFFVYRAIHFDNISTSERRKLADKFYHVRELFEYIVLNFQKFHSAGTILTIDEQLLPFRGRCLFKIYMPMKPAGYGIKTFALVDSETFYTLNLETYVDKQPEGSSYILSSNPYEVVLRIVEPVINTGRHITADNWFTSYDLVVQLASLKLSYLETIRKNKAEIPPEFQPIKSRQHLSTLFRFNKAVHPQIKVHVDVRKRCLTFAGFSVEKPFDSNLVRNASEKSSRGYVCKKTLVKPALSVLTQFASIIFSKYVITVPKIFFFFHV